MLNKISGTAVIKAAVLFVSIAVVLSFIPFIRVLSITDLRQKSEKIYSRSALDGFVISYTHSVNKGRVHDYYICTPDNLLQVEKTVFVSYGAGIPELGDYIEGAVFSITPQGYELSGFDRKVPVLVMAVGQIAEHSVTVNGDEFFLADYFRRKASLEFCIKRVSPIMYMLTRSFLNE